MAEADIMLPMRTGEIRIHDEAGFEGMRKAGRLVAECLDMLVGEVKPGVTTGPSGRPDPRICLRSWRPVGDHRLSRLSPCLVHFAQSRDLSRHTGGSRLQGAAILPILMSLSSSMAGTAITRVCIQRASLKRIATRLMDVTYESLMAGIAAVKPG